MTDLRMTPKRLELLQAIADGKVTHHMHWLGKKPARSQWDRGPTASPRCVTATADMRRLQDAGLARIGPRQDVGLGSPAPWVLTPSGEARLAGARAAEAALKSALASHRDVTG